MVEEKSIDDLAHELYETKLRFTLETSENIGKMVSIDVDSGDYELDKNEEDFHSANRLRARHPQARVYGIRIGYKAAYAIGTTLERIQR